MLHILLASLVCVCVCVCTRVCVHVRVYICLEDEETNILKVRVCQTHPFSHRCIRPKKNPFLWCLVILLYCQMIPSSWFMNHVRRQSHYVIRTLYCACNDNVALSSLLAVIVHVFVYSNQMLYVALNQQSSFEVHRSPQMKRCRVLPSKWYCS